MYKRQILHSFNGTVTLAPATIAVANDAFKMTMASVPYKNCGDIARTVANNAYTVTIGATIVQAIPSAPATGAAIDTACGTAGTAVSYTHLRMPKKPVRWSLPTRRKRLSGSKSRTSTGRTTATELRYGTRGVNQQYLAGRYIPPMQLWEK